MDLIINKLCRKCNQEYQLKQVTHSKMTRATLSNFENCPHCEARNDVWISISWPDDYKLIHPDSVVITNRRYEELTSKAKSFDDIAEGYKIMFRSDGSTGN